MAADLAACVDVEARMAGALVELERHPGHLTLAAGTCTGVTAQRWAGASTTLSGLGEVLATYPSGLDVARALGDNALEHATLTCAVALGGPDGSSEQMIALYSSQKARLPAVALTDSVSSSSWLMESSFGVESGSTWSLATTCA